MKLILDITSRSLFLNILMELPLQVFQQIIKIKISPQITFLDFILYINSLLPELITSPYAISYIDLHNISHPLFFSSQFEAFLETLPNVIKLTIIHDKLNLPNVEINDLHNTWYDVIIIGSGLAGLCTACRLIKSNKHLRIGIVEKERVLGGNSIKASSGISLINTPTQRLLGIKDSTDLFVNDTLSSGKGKSDPLLVRTLAEGSEKAWNFLTEECGIDLSKVTQCGGHSVPRTHRPKGNKPVGFIFVNTLLKKLSKYPISFFKNCEAKAIIENKGIVGLVLEKEGRVIRCRCSAIVIATGGYANDHTKDSLLEKYAPALKNFPTTSGDFAQGEGIKIASKIGAVLIDMNEIQIHPTGFIDPKKRDSKAKILAPELLRGVGGILVNEEGKRFCNELGKRDYITKEILKNCKNRISILILGSEAPISFGTTFFFYVKRGLIKKFDTLKELCEEYKLPIENLISELKDYNVSKTKGQDRYGKVTFPSVIDPYKEICYYGAEVTPSLHYTMGGLKVNVDGAVYGQSGLIRGLYAVGESTGGVHGKNRLVGNSLMECVVFGQRVGKVIAKNLKQGTKL